MPVRTPALPVALYGTVSSPPRSEEHGLEWTELECFPVRQTVVQTVVCAVHSTAERAIGSVGKATWVAVRRITVTAPESVPKPQSWELERPERSISPRQAVSEPELPSAHPRASWSQSYCTEQPRWATRTRRCRRRRRRSGSPRRTGWRCTSRCSPRAGRRATRASSSSSATASRRAGEARAKMSGRSTTPTTARSTWASAATRCSTSRGASRTAKWTPSPPRWR